MSMSNKYIEKVENYKKKVLDGRLAELKVKYRDADEFYRDTGYDRYFNKMEKIDAEIEEIEKYLKNGQTEVVYLESRDYSEYIRLKRAMETVKNKVLYLSAEIGASKPAELIRLEEFLKDF